MKTRFFCAFVLTAISLFGAENAPVKFVSRTFVGAEDARLIADYDSYRLYETTPEKYAALAQRSGADIRAVAMDTLHFDHFPVNTRRPLPNSLPELPTVTGDGPALHLVQFAGPLKQAWLDQLRQLGIEPVHYIHSNGYLVWADESARQQLQSLVSAENQFQFEGPYLPQFKLGSNLLERVQAGLVDDKQTLKITIQMLDHQNKAVSESIIDSLILEGFTAWTPLLRYQNRIVLIRAIDLPALTALPDVVWVGEVHEREMFDEVQGQIMAANFDGTMSGPDGPGYLTWLDGYGFPHNPGAYPLLDLSDDGVGDGTLNSGDPTLHELGDIGNPSRLMYVNNCTTAADGRGRGGHGHLNTNIAVGYDQRTGDPFQDPDGFYRGLGINPFGMVGSTRIFAPGFSLSNCGGTDTGLIRQISTSGADISSNSWGCSSCASQYDDSSQAFDVGVRDADLTMAGNQELIFIFSAGNSGPGGGTIGTPGNGKNMITVGASENDRATWTDGCNIGPSGANNAMDVISFSSRGPSPGGRVKPEIIAPGTHIQGTASTSPDYNGTGVCDQFHPPGQTVYAASSGTSHSTPAISGLATLAYYLLQNELTVNSFAGTYRPSPAVMKAFMMAHAGTYLTGQSANDTLPSNVQGYGMPHMGEAFDDSARVIYDQNTIFDNSGESWTISGSVADPDKPVRVALAYTDEAGQIGTSPQVNDLNLTVSLDGTTYLGNVFNGRFSETGGSPDANNNYEAVFFPANAGTALTITVDAFNIAGDGVPNVGDGTDQDFALVVYNFAEQPDFTILLETTELTHCAPADLVIPVEIGSILGFGDDVTLAVVDAPAGASVSIAQNPITPPGNTTITLGNTGGITPGEHVFQIEGTSTTGTKSRTITLNLSDAVPTQTMLTSPADNQVDVPLEPVLMWQEATQAEQYLSQLATDMAFTNIVFEGNGTTTSAAPPRLDPLTTYYWRVRADNVCGMGTFSDTFSFITQDQPLYFTELFNEGEGDLVMHTTAFVPDNGVSHYFMCGFDTDQFNTDPIGGTVLSLTDDDTEVIDPTMPIKLYGTEWDQLFVNSNGSVSFGAGNTTATESLSRHFQDPQVSGWFDDLNPSVSGTVSWKELPDRVAITWDEVPEFNENGSLNSFQIEFFDDGRIQITHLAMGSTDGIVGLSNGGGVPPDFFELDLSMAPNDCMVCPGDFNNDQMVDLADLGVMVEVWGQAPQSHDLNHDGVADLLDLVHLIGLLGPCPK